MVPRYGWPRIPAEQWFCSAAQAAYHGLPRKLEDAAQALGLDVQKDAEGHRLMKQMSKPRPQWKKTGKGPKWFEDDERLERLYEYCKRDVEVEYALSQALDELPQTERKIWMLDQTINRRGIYCDVELAQSAITIIEDLEDKACAELRELTDGEISTPGQVSKLVDYLNKNFYIKSGIYGVFDYGEFEGPMPDLQAATIEKYLSKTADLRARRILEIRQLHSKASTKKYQAMLDRADDDQRIRDTILYHGAHTGRWTGVSVQPQNFFKPKFDRASIEQLAIPAIKQHDITELEFLFGDPVVPLSSTLRSTLCAAPGKDLIGADYASIEARVLLWLVKDFEALQKIEAGVDLYVDMAASIYNTPLSKITTSQRALGKTAILGLGYGMGAAKFYDTCLRFGIEIDQGLAERTVSLYRQKYRKVVNYWRSIDSYAILSAEPFSKHGRFLRLKLPSGRYLNYCDPKIRLNRFDESALTYMGLNTITRKWERTETYGGKLTENIVQAIARDIMALGMLRVETAGYPIVMTVHDEIVSEVDKGFGSVDEFVRLLCQQPPWAKGCPISAEGWRGERYRK
jgi:DNA polymerase